MNYLKKNSEYFLKCVLGLPLPPKLLLGGTGGFTGIPTRSLTLLQSKIPRVHSSKYLTSFSREKSTLQNSLGQSSLNPALQKIQNFIFLSYFWGLGASKKNVLPAGNFGQFLGGGLKVTCLSSTIILINAIK